MAEEDRGSDAVQGRDAFVFERRAARVISWEHSRLRQAMPLVVRRCMSFSAMPCFDDALVAAAKDFYGLDMDVATAEAEILEDDDERIRFFPWFLWDWRVAPGLPTVGERFLRDEEHAEYEVRLLEGLTRSYVGFYQALEDASCSGVNVRDLATGEELRVTDDGLVGELTRGQILQARLVRLGGDPDPCVLVDAVYAVLPSTTLQSVATEIESLPTELGGVEAALKACTAELLELAEHLLEVLAQPPVATNADGERLTLCRSLLPGDATERALAAFRAGAPGFVPDGAGVWRWQTDGRVSGFAHELRDGRLALCATSPRLLDLLEAAVAALAEADAPVMRTLTDFGVAIEQWASKGGGDVWLRTCPDVLAATRIWIESWAATWADVPWQELGDRTPREAVRLADGRRRVEGVIARLERLQGQRPALASAMEIAALRRELGL